MKPSFLTLAVASGADPTDLLEVMVQRDYGEYIYHPGGKVQGVHHEQENLTPINQSWMDKWHRENPEYELRRVGHFESHDDFHPQKAVAMPSTDMTLASGHHQIYADVVHTPTQTKVGSELLLSLGSWPRLDSGAHDPREHATTAHIWSFYRHNKPYEGEPDPHKHIMTNVLDSWLNHAKAHGIRHGFINTDASHGYWLKNITRHPDMVWGGVEKTESSETRPLRQMDRRKLDTIKTHQNLFAGWPIGKRAYESVDDLLEMSDQFVMRWNQEHPEPTHHGGPIPTHLYRVENGEPKQYEGTLDRACFHHALRNAKRKGSNLKLAVGFAVKEEEAQAYEQGGDPPLMFAHAFNIRPNGEIHDPTWGSHMSKGMRYYGHVIEDPHQFKHGQHLMNWFGQHYQVGHDRGPSAIHLGQMTKIDHSQPTPVPSIPRRGR